MVSKQTSSRAAITQRALLAITIASGAVGAGCSPPQVARQHRELVASLLTAVSARNPDWLAANVKLIENARAEGDMGDAEYQAFRSIVAKAEAGDWQGAERDAFALREAQNPTAEDIAALQRRETSGPREINTRKLRTRGANGD